MFDLDPKLNSLPSSFQSPAGPWASGCENCPGGCQTAKDKPLFIHLVGIGGVAMAGLAGLLKDRGYQVSGSDRGVYPPMSDILAELGVPIAEGYGPGSLPKNVDLVIIGNVVTRNFPVLESIRDRRLHYLSLPQALNRLFLSQTRNLVIAGCHGKTGTTALAARLWQAAGWEPGFLIGGAVRDFDRAFQAARGEWFIIEGDEYDSAFFNKVPKFIHYRPHTVILTSVDFDHADIYPDLAAVVEAFESLMDLIPPEGRLVAWGDDPLVRQVAAACAAPVEFYGFGGDNHWRISGLETRGFSVGFELSGPEGLYLRLSLPRPGRPQTLNAAAVAAAFLGAGGEPRLLAPILAEFQGPKRRLECLGVFGGVTLIDDFAHHPTAVSGTLTALKAAFPDRPLWAAFEPRSNTSRRAVFQDEYARSLAPADRVFLRRVSEPEKAPAGDRLDVDALARTHLSASVHDDGSALGRALLSELTGREVVVMMSNGSFDGLGVFLRSELARRTGQC